jgi:hypothetical protein
LKHRGIDCGNINFPVRPLLTGRARQALFGLAPERLKRMRFSKPS